MEACPRGNAPSTIETIANEDGERRMPRFRLTQFPGLIDTFPQNIRLDGRAFADLTITLFSYGTDP
jgi:hypothetical protein